MQLRELKQYLFGEKKAMIENVMDLSIGYEIWLSARLERLTDNANVATFLGSILVSSETA